MKQCDFLDAKARQVHLSMLGDLTETFGRSHGGFTSNPCSM